MTSRNKSWRDDLIRPETSVRKYSNRLIELVEEGILDPVNTVRMCVKYMSEDDVTDMCNCNELTDLMFSDSEEEDEDYEMDEEVFPYGLGFSEDEEEAVLDSMVHDLSEEELREMGCFDNLNDEEEE